MKSILPVGIQDFAKLRKKGALYVDKTALIHQLITGSGEAFFLSRPRRFGKSLLCSTLEAIFEGRRELFGEYAGKPALAINSLNWEWKKHPVILIDLNAGVYSNGVETLHSSLYRELNREARKQNVVLDNKDCISDFATLIEKSYNKTGEGVVVIIDEYDKPLLNSIDYPDIHKKIRDELKGFYGILKSYDRYLQFVLLTGVSKFSHVSVFSDLNHLTDLTLDPEYADICGMTQEEVEQNFEHEITDVLQKKGLTREEYLEDLRLFYNGYRFSKKELKVYNSFGLLKHFRNNGDFQNYWYETGTPTFLINIISKQKVNILDLNKLEVCYSDFQKYDIETMRAEPLLYQTGYLTISGYNSEVDIFTLDYPNEEVRSCFAKSLLEDYAKSSEIAFNALSVNLL